MIFNATVARFRSGAGYTLVEMMVSIAILSIMLGMVGFNYNSGKNYETLKLESQRMASALRAARSRDFNSATKLGCAVDITNGVAVRACLKNSDCTTGKCSATYPDYGYGVHFEQRYNVCDNNTSKSCYDNADCPSSACGTPNLDYKSSYVLFADLSHPSGVAPYFNGGKAGGEFIEEYIAPKDFRPYFFDGNSRCSNYDAAEIAFDSGTLRYKKRKGTWSTTTIYDDDGASKANEIGLILELWYAPGGTITDSTQTQKKHGKVTSNAQSLSIDDAIIGNSGTTLISCS